MQQSRLNILIKKLTKKEKRQFKQFLISPFFNKRADLVLLFQLLDKQDHISKEGVFVKLYPETAYSDAKMRLCMSLLLKQLEQFLLINQYLSEEQDFTRKRDLVDIYTDRDLPKHIATTLKDATLVLDKQSYRNAQYFSEKQDLLNVFFQYKQQQTSVKDLTEISETLDINFILNKLKQACIKITLESVYKVEVELHFLDACMEYIQQKELLTIPAVAVYYYCYRFLENSENKDDFEKFNELLFDHAQKFSERELSDLVIAAINFCVRQYNSGNRNFLERHLALYQFGFKNDIFLVKGELSRYTYQNAVTFGLILKAYDWVHNIIENYKNNLPKQYKKSTYSFNLARLLYERNNKNEALMLLQKADSRDVFQSLAAKMLQLQIYYELEEFDLLESHIGAMGTYIRRKKIIGYHREIYGNSLKFAQKLLELNPYDKSQRKQLHADILATKVLAEKEWLLQQLGL